MEIKRIRIFSNNNKKSLGIKDIFNKEISPLDIKQEVANEDIFDLIYEIICEFDCNDKFNLEYPYCCSYKKDCPNRIRNAF